MESPAPILYCRCAYAKVVPQDVKDEVLRQMSQDDVPFDAVSDLCEMSARRDPVLARLAAQPNLKIVACYPRAVKWLFAAAKAPLPPANVQVLNMRTMQPDEIIGGLRHGLPAAHEDEA